MTFADIDAPDSSRAGTISSLPQQMSVGFGLACGSLVAGWYLGGMTMPSFWSPRPGDGGRVSRGRRRKAE